jgi:hypothetical protein
VEVAINQQKFNKTVTQRYYREREKEKMAGKYFDERIDAAKTKI